MSRIMQRPPITAVAIPVRDEAGRIGACLEALDAQAGAQLDAIVLLVNNTTDGTVAIAREVPLRPGTTLHIIERTLPPEQATAGHARQLAMAAAVAIAGPSGVVLTTDADGQVEPDWLAATLAIIAAGADAVAGWVELHPIEWGAIPARLHEDDARECAYDALLDEIRALLDPDPADPAPRHTQNSGASIAVTTEAYRRCGGVPAIASGEDRALIAALRRVDARVRHAPEVHVTVSGRTEGRSKGGMADTIRRRLVQPDLYIDDRLEPAAACARRARSRAALRRAYAQSVTPLATIALQHLARDLQLDESVLARHLAAPYFGEAWEAVERSAPALAHTLVPVTALAAETQAATAILRGLRPLAHPAGRSGKAVLAPEERD